MTRLATTQAGEGGVPCILLHGFAANRHYWQPAIGRLSTQRLVIAIDLPGHGDSAGHPGQPRTAAMRDAVSTFMAESGIPRAHLVGHSMGGAIACLLALKEPRALASLTLLAPGGFGTRINAGLLRSLATSGGGDQLASLLAAMRAEGPVDRQGLELALADRHRESFAQRMTAIADSFLRGDSQGVLPLEALASLPLAGNLIWGRRDRVTPVEQCLAAPAAFSRTIIENAGHALLDEKPAAVTRAILQGLQRGEALSPCSP